MCFSKHEFLVVFGVAVKVPVYCLNGEVEVKGPLSQRQGTRFCLFAEGWV